ncbi:MAG: histidine phosphatase family protein [Ruminococcus sp.]|nr:histidine phosphatase family protein [Ruminococcus sp.]
MLYIIRHGKTDWNLKHKLQGRTDIPLNDEGRAMALEAGERYKDVHFDVCYCSPLIRARETAELLLKGRDVPIIVDDRLVEMCFGEYEGVENSFSIPDCPINTLFYHPEEYTEAVGGGETLDELYARTGNFLDEVALPLVEEGKDVLIVGHGAMNSSIVSRMRGMERKDFWSAGIENCKLMQLP